MEDIFSHVALVLLNVNTEEMKSCLKSQKGYVLVDKQSTTNEEDTHDTVDQFKNSPLPATDDRKRRATHMVRPKKNIYPSFDFS